MDTIIFPPPTATTREMLEFYRREKLKNRQIAHHIDSIYHAKYAGLTKETLITDLKSKLQRREDQLSPLGNEICHAILRLSNTDDQIAVEMRYLDAMPIRQIAIELHCSEATIRHRIHRAIQQMTISQK